ncbi:MAG: hypothetical protein H6878_02420 [Rhodobiaceae bacterium]|nr:hypothetical protein [Rhodobiaceae bacterium]
MADKDRRAARADHFGENPTSTQALRTGALSIGARQRVFPENAEINKKKLQHFAAATAISAFAVSAAMAEVGCRWPTATVNFHLETGAESPSASPTALARQP